MKAAIRIALFCLFLLDVCLSLAENANSHLPTAIVAVGSEQSPSSCANEQTDFPLLQQQALLLSTTTDTTLQQQHIKKLTAVILTLVAGPLGLHRLYLGTSPQVAVLYAITLGGVGVLPLIDIITILVTPNIKKYEDNPKVLMWIK